jgi:hypothetical protein
VGISYAGRIVRNALTPDGLSDFGEGGDFHDARVPVENLRA